MSRSITLECPEASYDEHMRIRCEASGSVCAHQKWCMTEGRAKLTDSVQDCPGRTHPHQEELEEE